MRFALALILALLLLTCLIPWVLWHPLPAQGPVIVLGLPRTIDPALASRVDEFRLISALFEPLIRLQSTTLAPEPALATSWEIAPDRLSWTFHLRPDACWSDGRPVTAADMRRGLLRHLIQQSPNAFYLDAIITGAACSERDLRERRDFLEHCGIHALDAHTLTINLTHPVANLMAILSLAVFVPATEAQMAETDLLHQAAVWIDPTRVVGNGPMVCTDTLARHHFDFAPNPAYHGAHPAKGRMRALLVENPGTALRLYLTGQADAILLLPADAVGDVRRCGLPGLQQVTSLGTAFLRVRVIPRPVKEQATITKALGNIHLRVALARSINRPDLVNGLLQGDAAVACTFVPADLASYLPYHAPTTLLSDDLEQAKREIALARSELGSIPPLELIVTTQPAERLSAAELLADGWRRTLGVEVTITGLQSTELRGRERDQKYDLDFGIWLGDFLDPITFLDCFRSDAGANRTGFADPGYDKLLDSAALAQESARWGLLEDAERRLLAAPPLIPLYHTKCSFLVRPGLEGIHANPLEIVHFDEVGWR